MGVIVILMTAGVIVAGIFLWSFIWAVRSGQFEDNFSPSNRILFDDTSKTKNNSIN